MKKMGYAENNMDSRIPSGSASSASGYSLRSRGPSAKSKISPFFSCSSSKLTQSIIKDHMVSHYKRIYSAKAVIDTSVPKSLLCSVKYNDQLKRAGSKNGIRPQSAYSLSQRSRVSCSPAQSRLSLQYNESPYRCSSSSTVSSHGPSTSFHPKTTVYPSFKADFHRWGSESNRRIQETSFQRQRSAYSLGATGDHYKSFQDPFQKTYSGDLLQKHSQWFIEDKPFTPKTLKSEKSSYLSKYRYYRAPQRKAEQSPNSSLHHQEKLHKSTSNREPTQEIEERSQGFTTDPCDLTEDDYDSYVLASKQPNLTHRQYDLPHSFSRVAYEGRKCVNAEEEELKYLEFITAVTDDILSRGFISDSIVDRVINRHIDMNCYNLDEGKMRHLLEVLRRDLAEPNNAPISTLKLEREENHLLDALMQKDDLEETKEYLRYETLIQNSDLVDYTDPILTSTLMSEPERTSVLDLKEKATLTPQLSTHDSFSEDVHQNQSENEIKGDMKLSEERLLKELDEVGTVLESLNVSDHSHCDNTDNEEHTSAAISDDEF